MLELRCYFGVAVWIIETLEELTLVWCHGNKVIVETADLTKFANQC